MPSKAPGKLAGSPKESLIVKQIETALRYWRVLFWRMYTGPRVYKGNKFLKSLQVGMPDIIGVLPNGRFFSIEVKRPGGKVTDAQLDTHNAIREAGGIAFIATGIEDVERELGGQFSQVHDELSVG